ncbi:hypothetical protein BY996DRAFT_7758639 [Phakopsora pachyrhizi]|nr:hypothetical protein BY996DRAFT_7758639 [Phakopsora pachyrhizi]
MARLWSYSIRYCPFLIDLWLNPICYVCFMPICGFIQFDMSAFCLFVVLCNLISCIDIHVEPVVLFNFLVLCFEKDLTLKLIQF